MLKILALPPASQGKEQEPAPQEVTIIQTETGIFKVGGVTFQLVDSNQEMATLNIGLTEGYNAWLDGDSVTGSMYHWAINQARSRPQGLPENFTKEITLESFFLAAGGQPVTFSVMKKKLVAGWKKLSNIQLSYTP